MKLTFPWSELTRAFEEIDSATAARQLYDIGTGKGLWLVGDDGVYLMPNTTDGIHHAGGGPCVVIYARECNPTTMSFEEWWSAKQASFGGDDRVEFLDVAELRALAKATTPRPAFLQIDFKKAVLSSPLSAPTTSDRARDRFTFPPKPKETP